MKRLFSSVRVLFFRFYGSFAFRALIAAYLLAIIGGLGTTLWGMYGEQRVMVAEVSAAQTTAHDLSGKAAELAALQQEDQVVKNASLSARLAVMQKTYADGADMFNQVADLNKQGIPTAGLDSLLAQYLADLGKEQYESAASAAAKVQSTAAGLIAKQAASVTATANAPTDNTLHGPGFYRQSVTTDTGTYTVAMVVADSPKVIVDTASDSDCGDNCPVLSLADYVTRNGGFAGINGAYFCPPDYSSCQGKTNSFDTLAYNGRTHHALNTANNVYSVVPLFSAYGSSLHFYGRTLDWGVDSAATGALANHPLLLVGGNIAFDPGSVEAHQMVKGPKGFIGVKGSLTVIGHVLGASVVDEAHVLKTLGLEQALNLDGGGSSALWYGGGYKVGPGRLLPTAVVFVK